MTKYVLSPLVKFSRLDSESRTVLRAGSGDNRGHYVLDGEAAQPIIDLLLGCVTASDMSSLVDALSVSCGLDSAESDVLVSKLIEMNVLVGSEDLAAERDHLARWGRFGWRDAADYHLATSRLRFIPDDVAGVAYADHFSRMLADTLTAGEQPPRHVARDGAHLAVDATSDAHDPSLGEVLAQAEPINRFEGRPIRGGELLPPLRKAFGVQRTVGGLLGNHQFRSYPSGGARHPFEVYLVSKGIDGVPAGVYQFDPENGDLISLQEQGDPRAIDVACFGKGGILSADAVLVLTCRWLRHSWKYRYARSYRMLLLEVGHIVQAIHLSMVRHGVQVYHCPSIDDQVLGDILVLDDDCAEGPLYAIGLGHGGTR
jgi:SagB-type dehydrogenase family enzyme